MENVNTKFMSRLTGEWIEKGDCKTINEKYPDNFLLTDDECKAFGIVGELLSNKVPIDYSILNILYSRWNFDHNIIKECFEYFQDFDNTERYLSIMDGDGDGTLVGAWEIWCIETGAQHEIECNCFLKN